MHTFNKSTLGVFKMKILQSIYEAKDKQKLSNTKRVYCPPGKGKTNKMDFSQY